MSSVVDSSLLSASKLRRMRSVATKQKLFQLTQKDERWSMVHSQLATLTYTIDCLVQVLTASTFGYPYIQHHLNPAAPEFVPTEDQCGVVAKAPEEVQASALSCETRSIAVHSNCTSCWEPLPCSCAHLRTCMQCSVQFGIQEPMRRSGTCPRRPKSSNVAVELPAEITAMLEETSLQAVDFFDTCRTLVATTVLGRTRVIDNVPREALSGILAKLREQKVAVKSYLGKSFDASLYPALRNEERAGGAFSTTKLDGHSLPKEGCTDVPSCGEDEDSIADFSRDQLDHVVDAIVQQFVDKYGTRSGTTISDYSEIADSVKKALPPHSGPDENDRLFTRGQVRKLIEVVTASCTKALEERL